MKDQHLETGEYDPRSYWNARARASEGDIYAAVCGFGLSRPENRAMERVQLATIRSFLRFARFSGNDVLELGCGVGRLALSLFDRDTRYTGVDISTEMLAIARRAFEGDGTFHVLTSDVLPAPDESYDLTFSITVIHHNPYERHEGIASEMVRVTRPGGLILLIEGIGDGQSTFNMFPRPIEGWTALFERHGLRMIRMRPLEWCFFRNYIAYAPLRILRRITGRPARMTTMFDTLLARPSGYLDPYLMPLLPRRLATSVALMFRKPGDV